MRTIVRFFMKIIFCKIFYRVKFFGEENVKNLDKCIICANHSNKYEPTWLYSNIDNLFIMAKAELFENKIIAKLYRYFGIFPIRRGQKDVKSIMHAINLFDTTEKRKLLIFPEGERMPKEIERGPAKVGPTYIAAKAGVRIVPTYITKNASVFSKVKVIYGNPIEVPKEIIKDKEKLKEFSEELLNIIYSLKGSD